MSSDCARNYRTRRRQENCRAKECEDGSRASPFPKPRCQKTECRRVARIGSVQAGSRRVNSNKHSLQVRPVRGNKVSSQIQNNHVADVSWWRVFHAHQQPHNIVSAKKVPAERPNNSCIAEFARLRAYAAGLQNRRKSSSRFRRRNLPR
jgi:hypothetical protein